MDTKVLDFKQFFYNVQEAPRSDTNFNFFFKRDSTFFAENFEVDDGFFKMSMYLNQNSNEWFRVIKIYTSKNNIVLITKIVL